MTATQAYELILLALCNWREARGEPIISKYGQAWCVRNRVFHPGWWGNSWVSVILFPEQYSAFNPGDPNATKLPPEDDAAWNDCKQVAQDVYYGTTGDPTGGATNYFDKSLDANPPAWASAMTHTTDIGSFRFYR